MTFVIILLILIVVGAVIYAANNSNNKIPESKPEIDNISFTVTTSDKKKEHDPEYDEYVKKYPKWFSENDTVGICFESERIEPLLNGQTETVYYKTNRFADLFGRGKDCSYFPGYGEIHNRTFEVWFQETNTKDKKEIQIYKDIANVTYAQPVYIEKITNGISTTEELERSKGYMKLFKGKDIKNRGTWYAGMIESEFTGIITKGEK